MPRKLFSLRHNTDTFYPVEQVRKEADTQFVQSRSSDLKQTSDET